MATSLKFLALSTGSCAGIGFLCGMIFFFSSVIAFTPAAAFALLGAPLRIQIHGYLFLGLIDNRAAGHLFEVDLVGVKFRAVHAGKFSLASHCDPAAAAHAGTV